MALTAKKVYAILKRQISDMEAKLNSPVRYRGTVATADLLPLNPDIGDMYNIESKSVYGEAGMNVAWNGVVWDTMGAPIDMSLYLTKEEADAVIQRLVTEYFEKNPVKPGATAEQAQQIEQNKTDIGSLKTETGSLKEDLINYGSNLSDLFRRYVLTDYTDGYVDKSTGEIKPSTTWNVSKKIICYGLNSIVIRTGNVSEYNAFYDKDGKFISSFNTNIYANPIIVPENAYYYIVSQDKSHWDTMHVCTPLNLEDIKNREYVSSDITFRFNDVVLSNSGNTILFKGRINGYSVTNGNFSYSFEQLKSLFISDVSGEYIKIADWYAWVYNIDTKAIEKVYYNDIKLNHIVIIRNIDGRIVDCKLFDYLYGKKVDLLENGVDTSIAYLTDNFDTPIRNILNYQDKDSVSIVLMTDNHHKQVGNQIPAVKSIQKVLDNCDIKAVVVGGDNIIDTIPTYESEVSIMREIMNEYYKLDTKILPIVGNHDDLTFQCVYNTIQQSDVTDFCIKPQLMNTLTMKRSDDFIVRDSNNILGNYYYYDIPNTDIRVLCLNTNDIPYDLTETKTINEIETKVYKYSSWNHTAISEAQANWVSNMLSNFNGKLIVFSHVPLALMKGNEMPINGDCIVEILKAWKNGTSVSYVGTNTDIPCVVNQTFSGTHDIIGCFGGHTHYDNLVNNDGINYVSTLNSSCSQWSDAPTRTAGTYSEIAFDAITVLPSKRKVKITRFGAGSDREYTY